MVLYVYCISDALAVTADILFQRRVSRWPLIQNEGCNEAKRKAVLGIRDYTEKESTKQQRVTAIMAVAKTCWTLNPFLEPISF